MGRHYTARTDSNHSDVGRWYRELHCSTLDIHVIGGGAGDWLVGIAGLANEIVEVKTADGSLNGLQQQFHREWRGPKPVQVTTQDDVIAHVTSVRSRLRR